MTTIDNPRSAAIPLPTFSEMVAIASEDSHPRDLLSRGKREPRLSLPPSRLGRVLREFTFRSHPLAVGGRMGSVFDPAVSIVVTSRPRVPGLEATEEAVPTLSQKTR